MFFSFTISQTQEKGNKINKNAKKYAGVHTDISNNYEIGKVYTKNDSHIRCYRKFDKIICVSHNAKEGFAKTFVDLDTLCVKYNVINDIKIKLPIFCSLRSFPIFVLTIFINFFLAAKTSFSPVYFAFLFSCFFSFAIKPLFGMHFLCLSLCFLTQISFMNPHFLLVQNM